MQSYRRLQLSKSVKIQSRVNSDTNMSQVCHNNAELLFIYLFIFRGYDCGKIFEPNISNSIEVIAVFMGG